MNECRIGTTVVHNDNGALIVHCPVLRTAGPALMLALFGGACSVIAFTSFAGLVGAGNSAASSLLALAFAGVFVLPLLGVGALFIAVALWRAFNALTAATASGELRIERRWCGLLLSKKSVSVDSITAIDCVSEARFVGIFGGVHYFRLLAHSAAGTLLLADHLRAAGEAEAVRQLFIAAFKRPELCGGRCDHHSDAEAAVDAA